MLALGMARTKTVHEIKICVLKRAPLPLYWAPGVDENRLHRRA